MNSLGKFLLCYFGIAVSLNGGPAVSEINASSNKVPTIKNESAIAKTSEQDHLSGIVESERKYAVLLIDSTMNLTPSTAFVILHLEQELENMGYVLNEANSKGLPVYEINMNNCSYNDSDCLPENPPPTARALAKYRADNWVDIRKHSTSAFEYTKLDELLKKQGITDLILMGYNQAACVFETAMDARNLGYAVYTSFDVMQGMRSFTKCEYTVNGVSSIEKCSLLDLNPVNWSPGMKVSPTEFSFGHQKGWYAKKTNLVDDYKELPIFQK
ncbi:isochorismatase family protein [Nanoarchaeota archaeon]